MFSAYGTIMMSEGRRRGKALLGVSDGRLLASQGVLHIVSSDGVYISVFISVAGIEQFIGMSWRTEKLVHDQYRLLQHCWIRYLS